MRYIRYIGRSCWQFMSQMPSSLNTTEIATYNQFCLFFWVNFPLKNIFKAKISTQRVVCMDTFRFETAVIGLLFLKKKIPLLIFDNGRKIELVS